VVDDFQVSGALGAGIQLHIAEWSHSSKEIVARRSLSPALRGAGCALRVPTP